MATPLISKPHVSFQRSYALPIAPRATALVFEDLKSKALLEKIHLISASSANVLVTGETGTGKELIARHEKARNEFSIPPDFEPVAVAAIGYPGSSASLPDKLRKKELSPRKRKPLTDIVFEGEWGRSAT